MEKLMLLVALFVCFYHIGVCAMGLLVPRILTEDRWTFRTVLEFVLSIVILLFSYLYIITFVSNRSG